jgi:diadenosine tetraphosphate (Ap4A) HIT family hydrolase
MISILNLMIIFLHTFSFPVTTSLLSTSRRSFKQSFRTVQKMTMKKFGKFNISKEHIFLQSESSFSFVNLRPIVEGHVLVSPERVVARLADLTYEEYVDLWISVRKTQELLVKVYGPCSFNVAVQDGKASGQSVPHVHVHILPRRDGDFERNDDIYDELQEWSPSIRTQQTKAKLVIPDEKERVDRTHEAMTEEATKYRLLVD